jgi:hypothetical protein
MAMKASHLVLAAAIAGVAAAGGGVALSQSNLSFPVGVHPPGTVARHPQPPTGYSARLMHICAGAVLFEGTHSIGTRAGAIAVARDISTSGNRRLNRADAVPKPLGVLPLANRWIAIERRLTEMYANNYLRIWYAIERAHTPAQRAELPSALRALINEPRPLERQASALETTLNVPDCTGGSPPRTDQTGGSQA